MSVPIAHAHGVADADTTADTEPASEYDRAADAYANTADSDSEPDSKEDVRRGHTRFSAAVRCYLAPFHLED